MEIKDKINRAVGLYSYFSRDVVSKAHPTIFQIEPTNHCPMTCFMCPRTTLMKREKGFMDIELFRKIIDQAEYTKDYIHMHHFGESLTHPQFPEMISYCHKKGVKTRVSVNPPMLSKTLSERLVSSGLDAIHLSLDGMDDATYKSIRGPAANYALAVENIHNLLKVKEEHGGKTPHITIAIILMKATEKQVAGFRKKWTLPGVDKVMVKSFSIFGSNENFLDYATEESANHIRKNPLVYPCRLPWESVVVMWDGKVVPCCYDYDAKYVLGNLNTDGLEEIWNGEKMQELRRQHITSEFKDNPFCGKCKERYGNPGFDQPIEFLKEGVRFALRRLEKSSDYPV